MKYHDYMQDINYLINNKLGLDDTFEFRCRSCGKCCKNREDVIFTPYDLFRIARFLGRDTAEIIDGYCDMYVGPNTHIPIVHMKPVGPEKVCPFLRDRKCMIHNAKPGVCAVFPLARILGEGEKTYFVLNPRVNCGRKDGERTTTVRNWIRDHALEESTEAARLWGASTSSTWEDMTKLYNTASEKTWETVTMAFVTIAYLGYDIKADFLPQFTKRMEDLKELCAQMVDTLNSEPTRPEEV